MSERSYLEEISIRNLGIIDSSSLELSKGLNVLTGETGAGKTMILTALSLLLGSKSDSALVRHGSERLVASATFSIPESLRATIEDRGGFIEDGSIILSRTVNNDGKSKATASGTTVTASALSEITEPLIAIHGQSANSQIVKSARQRELLDLFAGVPLHQKLTIYLEIFQQYNELKAKLKSLLSHASERDSQIASLEALTQQWSSLKPVRDEYAAIEDEIRKLASVEDLRVAAAGALQALGDEDSGALTVLGTVRKFLENAKEKDPALDEISSSIAESFFLIDDAHGSLASYLASLEADPKRLDFLNDRKATIASFVKKWGGAGSVDEEMALIAIRVKNAKETIGDLSGGQERISAIEKELSDIKAQLLVAAQEVSSERVKAAKNLSALVTKEISALSMPHTIFHADVLTVDYTGALKESDFTTTGCDEVTMSIQGHRDAPKVGLGKGASGGEMSRIMLALEVVIAASAPVGTYIFDEVDAGVGGKAAIEVGRRLHALSQHAQVIVVTHLPQVAAWADRHFVVAKDSDGQIVASGVTELTDQGRVGEIARMLAGLDESLSAQEHASELLALRNQ
uniref:DNA repair protein RecN n=1 Tax=Candidatus Planktophila sp. TaxID=2175601 RepID=UPI00404A902E